MWKILKTQITIIQKEFAKIQDPRLAWQEA